MTCQAPYFADYVKNQLIEAYGARTVFGGGLRVKTTIDLDLQKAAREAVAKWLPPDIIGRRKRGFETPVDRWFRSELSGYVQQTLLAPGAACPFYIRPAAIEALIHEHISGRHDHRRQLFSLLMFELWHRQFIGDSGVHRS